MVGGGVSKTSTSLAVGEYARGSSSSAGGVTLLSVRRALMHCERSQAQRGPGWQDELRASCLGQPSDRRRLDQGFAHLPSYL